MPSFNVNDIKVRRGDWLKIMNSLARRAIKRKLALPINWEGIRATARSVRILESIHKEIESELNSLRAADDYQTNGYKSQLENKDELYGREVDFGCGYRLHTPGTLVN